MTYRATRGTSPTIGRAGLGDRYDYVYRGTKLLKDEPPPRVPNPRGGRVPDPSVYRALRLATFKAALAEITEGAHPRDASAADVREAGKAAGVGEKTARAYRKELAAQAEASPT